MFKATKKFVSNNKYLFIGILIGLYISNFVWFPEEPCEIYQNDEGELLERESSLPKTNEALKNSELHMFDEPKEEPKEKESSNVNAKKQKPFRPRYYSTELGIREKLFVGILTSDEKVNAQAIHINKTISHIVDKLKFFITAQNKLKSKFNLTNLVGFTDTRYRYRPFQIIKYVADNFGQEYDYYFLANDFTFINAHRLKEKVEIISVSMDVYLGTRVADSSYCSLDAGILISNSVLKALREHLDWCVINAISDSHSENFGRCVHHSIGLTCQDSVQGVDVPSYKIKHFDLSQHLEELSKKTKFRKAATVFPILQKDDFYLLNAFFLKEKLAQVKKEINTLSDVLTETWPPGQRTGAKPATRFDLPRQVYFNVTHVFFPDDFTNVREHTENEAVDLKNIIDEVIAKVEFSNSELQYIKLINGYKTFDLSKGMDYTFDLEFLDVNTGNKILKRLEVSKPLGKVEFVQVPYVTENKRVTILLPIQESELSQARAFLNSYLSIMTDPREKTFLMLVLLYQNTSMSKGKEDVFAEVKNFALKTTSKFKNEDTKLAWLSVRLPSPTYLTLEENKALNFAIVDLALKKIGTENLVLTLRPHCNISSDFLNRVRMNTIQNFQIFSPIPFRQYNPNISEYAHLEVNKNSGHFDKEEYGFLSFYGSDYVAARKKYQYSVPIIRIDYDIANLLNFDYKKRGNIFEMFLKHSSHLHLMRATEMSLLVKYHEEKCEGRNNLFLGTKQQLATLFLTKQNSNNHVSNRGN